MLPHLMLAALCASPSADDPFASAVRPLLDEYCARCHGGLEPKADLDVDAVGDDDFTTWREIASKLRSAEMPPRGEPAPDDAARAHVAAAIEEHVGSGAPAARTPLRRISRAEFANSLAELLGVDRALADLPADGSGGEGFDNAAATLFASPLFVEHAAAAVDSAVRAASPLVIRDLLGGDDACGGEAVTRPALERWMTRVGRRPATENDVDRLLAVERAALDGGALPEDAFARAVRAALLSPRFLFHVECDAPGATPARDGAIAVDDFALADRLASFLWSSLPDTALADAAARGALHDDAELERQARRMVADPRSRALGETFAVQWLGVDRLLTTSAPAPHKFPTFTPALRDAMRAEVTSFFAELVHDDAPIRDIIDADFTFLNEELAKHYGIAGVAGPQMRKVTLRDRARGGVLGMAAVLTATSLPLRTSPVLRGKWILETLLSDPTPPPPPNVPDIGADETGKDDQRPLRPRLEAHRAKAECAACHARIDPLGFALENFDPIGRWRDTLTDQPVDARGQLPDGTAFDGPIELKRVLLARGDRFTTTLARKLLGAALGRGLEPSDDAAVAEIVARARDADDRLGALIVAVCASRPFRTRGGPR